MANNRTVVGMANRFRVFRFIKRVMQRENRCPDGVEVAKALNISSVIATEHMNALANADGLPFPIPSGAQRQRDLLTGAGVPLFDADLQASKFAAKFYMVDGYPLATDKAIAAGLLRNHPLGYGDAA